MLKRMKRDSFLSPPPKPTDFGRDPTDVAGFNRWWRNEPPLDQEQDSDDS